MIRICLMFTSIILLPFVCSAKSPKCIGSTDEMACLSKNLKTMYSNNYNETFKILRAGESSAITCENEKKVFSFFGFAPIAGTSGNAEVQEFYARAIERFFVTKSKCFLDNLLKQNEKEQKAILSILSVPTFENKSEISNLMEKASSDKIYSNLVRKYTDSKKGNGD